MEDIAYKTKTKIQIRIIIKGQTQPYKPLWPAWFFADLPQHYCQRDDSGSDYDIYSNNNNDNDDGDVDDNKDLIEGVGWPATLQGRRAAV